jgi:hypothetical protein
MTCGSVLGASIKKIARVVERDPRTERLENGE